MIEQDLGIRFNGNYLVKWLHAREHTPQKPAQPARERDEAAIARWREEDWPRLQIKAREEKAHLVLIDESGFFLNPLVWRTWAPKGSTPILSSWGRRRDKVTAETVVKFLRELLRHLRGRVIVVWDGGTNHKGPLIRTLCARHPRLHLERLPAYAPDLNTVEFIWGHLKHGRMANFVPASLPHLDRTAHSRLQSVGQIDLSSKTRIGLSMLSLRVSNPIGNPPALPGRLSKI